MQIRAIRRPVQWPTAPARSEPIRVARRRSPAITAIRRAATAALCPRALVVMHGTAAVVLDHARFSGLSVTTHGMMEITLTTGPYHRGPAVGPVSVPTHAKTATPMAGPITLATVPSRQSRTSAHTERQELQIPYDELSETRGGVLSIEIPANTAKIVIPRAAGTGGSNLTCGGMRICQLLM